MKADTISNWTAKVVQLLEKENLRIDEKMAISRAAGDLFQQIMVAETTVLSLRKSLENLYEGKDK